MRLRAYRDRHGCGVFGVEVDGRLLTGPSLERAGRLRSGLGTHSDVGTWIDWHDDWRPSLARATRRAIRRGARLRPVTDRLPAAPFPYPGKVVCVGLNYREHAAEGGRDAPPRPLLFAKFANAVVADGEPVIRPDGTHALDFEVELGVVIGRRAHRVNAATAMDHVAGYLVVNDVSARDWQGTRQALREGEKGDGQWLRAKGSDTFLPMGPVLVTPDEVDPAAGLRLRSWRITPDGTEHLMQDGNTRDLIWDVPALIEFISAAITLETGDIISTGTPSGVGVFRDPPVFLAPGDRMRCEIEGIGSVSNPVFDGSDVATS
jgi:2,4-didehydro-3-deoxy-L-rhamnonate hydrolase